MREEFLVEYAYSSNAIEGNTLTLQETAMVLEGVTIDKKSLRDYLEAVGHRDAFLYVQDFVTSNTLFTKYIIKQIHTLVLMNRGVFIAAYQFVLWELSTNCQSQYWCQN